MATREIPTTDLRVGDMLHNPHGKGTPIKSIEIARGCRNLHVNKTMCFDRSGFAIIHERGAV
jgi:hypothetical protein